uniref:Integrase catalytic domain-containing protein n=1 Tax=Romanomermis culicivorax TaxID=13658 RepID=A0A915J9C3_ROMCU
MAPYQNRFAIIVIDHLSSFSEVLLCPDHTAERMIEFLTELSACYGNLAVLVPDNRPEYRSDAFTKFLSKCDIQHLVTPIYHPQSNECPNPETFSPAEIMFNRCVRLPFEPRQSISEPAAPQLKKLKQNVGFEEKHQPKQQKPFCRNPLFHISDKVCIRRPASLIKKGKSPYSNVIEVVDVVTDYIFKLSEGNIWNARHMQKYYPVMVLNIPANDNPEPIPKLRHSTRSTGGHVPRRFLPG